MSQRAYTPPAQIKPSMLPFTASVLIDVGIVCAIDPANPNSVVPQSNLATPVQPCIGVSVNFALPGQIVYVQVSGTLTVFNAASAPVNIGHWYGDSDGTGRLQDLGQSFVGSAPCILIAGDAGNLTLLVMPTSRSSFPNLTFSNGLMPVASGGKVAAVINQATVNGNNDLFTVPAGQRAIFAGYIFNQSGGGLTITPQFKILGSYVQVAPASTPANNTASNFSAFNTLPIAEAGDIISFNCTGIMQIFGVIISMPVSAGILSPRLINPATGDNTLYTCPAGKRAFLTNASNAGNAPVRTFNQSGALRTYKLNAVPSGGSPAVANLLTIVFTTANGAQTNTALTSIVGLNPGDFINLNVDAGTANQFAWIVNLSESPILS